MSHPDNIKLEPMISAEDIVQRVEAMVVEVCDGFKGDEIVVVALLKGSFMFVADLVRQFHSHEVSVIMDFMATESYGSGTESSGTVKLTRDISTDVEGRKVLLVDDILDTGRTLDFARRHLMEKGAESVTTCAFLDKPDRRVVDFEADFIGFTIPDEFVVGYGLDYDSRYRALPHISKVCLQTGESGASKI